ncbi:MAG: hypothetical protein J5827_01000, partial [Oscillospiraceae bacterium]|nr:hypothetical protein [Oscillospiraceae bacterium]
MRKIFTFLMIAMLLGMAACSSAPSGADPAPPAPAEDSSAASSPAPDGPGETRPPVSDGGEKADPSVTVGDEDEDAEIGPEQTPAPSATPEDAQTAPGSEDVSDGEVGEEDAPDGEVGEAGETSPAGLDGSYWSASLYSRYIFDGAEYIGIGDTPMIPEDETVNLLLRENGEGLFRCSLWGPEDPDNGYLSWEVSHHGGAEQLRIDLASGMTLYGSVSDDMMTLDYYEGELTLVRLEYGPDGFELRPELLEGCWALESSDAPESGEDRYRSVEPGTRAYLTVADGKAGLYWYDGLLSVRSYVAGQLDAELSWQPMYFGCGNECWSAELTGSADPHKAFSVTALSPDRLEMLISTYSGTDPFPSVLRAYFERISPEEADLSGEPSAVTVSSAAELIAALHDGVTVTLKSGEYDIAGQLGEFSLPRWSYIGGGSGRHGLFAGYSGESRELVISGMSNITLRSEDPSAPARIVCSTPDANVLTFYGCSGIALENLVIAPSAAAGPDSGSGVVAEYCASLSLAGCELS